MPNGVLTFRRSVLSDDKKPKWIESKAPMSQIHMVVNKTIEEMHGLLQVDFANAFIVRKVRNHV